MEMGFRMTNQSHHKPAKTKRAKRCDLDARRLAKKSVDRLFESPRSASLNFTGLEGAFVVFRMRFLQQMQFEEVFHHSFEVP